MDFIPPFQPHNIEMYWEEGKGVKSKWRKLSYR